MPTFITEPVRIEAAGNKPKIIEEFAFACPPLGRTSSIEMHNTRMA